MYPITVSLVFPDCGSFDAVKTPQTISPVDSRKHQKRLNEAKLNGPNGKTEVPFEMPPLRWYLLFLKIDVHSFI